MALVNARNKKMIMTVLSFIGIAVVGIAVWIAVKTKTGFQGFWTAIKERVTPPTMLLMLGAALSYLFDAPSEYTYATLMFAAAASSATTFTADWIPQYLVFTAATVPTSITATVLGSNQQLLNVDGAGVDALNNLLKPNAATTAGLYVLPLANGLITSKKMTITFTNAVASIVNVYGINKILNGDRVFQTVVNQITANAGTPFYDFDCLTIPALGANDALNVTDRVGRSDKWELGSVNLMSTLDQAEEQAQVLNFGNPRPYSQVWFQPSAARNVYVSRFLRV